MGLSREYLTKGHDDKIVKAYYRYMVDVAVIYGADRNAAESELMDALNFEMALANVNITNSSLKKCQFLLLDLNTSFSSKIDLATK